MKYLPTSTGQRSFWIPPKEEDLKTVYQVPKPSDNNEINQSDSLFRHMTEMTILTVKLIVEFCKRLPGFDSLENYDQVTILKGLYGDSRGIFQWC